MSLNYDLTGISDWENLYRDNVAKTNAMLFGTMIVGVNKITDENWYDFYARLSLWQEMFGSLVVSELGDDVISPSDVKRFIGLTTNANAMTLTQFKNHFFSEIYNAAITRAKKEELNV